MSFRLNLCAIWVLAAMAQLCRWVCAVWRVRGRAGLERGGVWWRARSTGRGSSRVGRGMSRVSSTGEGEDPWSGWVQRQRSAQVRMWMSCSAVVVGVSSLCWYGSCQVGCWGQHSTGI